MNIKVMNAKSVSLVTLAVLGVLALPAQILASTILGSAQDFAVLGGSAVTNTPPSAISGSVGVWSSGGTNAITGFNSSFGIAVSDPQVTNGTVQAGTTEAAAAQGDLTNAITSLGLLGTGTTLDNFDLAGLTLTPGVYTVHAGTSNLTGALTLDGLGDVNATWVFVMDSTLNTSAGSSVNVINTGAGAGLFWDVGSSATLAASTSFLGNILAFSSITLGADASIGCGRALASTGAITMSGNIVSTDCDLSSGGYGSYGFSGSTVAAVPLPAALSLMGAGLLGLVGIARRCMHN